MKLRFVQRPLIQRRVTPMKQPRLVGSRQGMRAMSGAVPGLLHRRTRSNEPRGEGFSRQRLWARSMVGVIPATVFKRVLVEHVPRRPDCGSCLGGMAKRGHDRACAAAVGCKHTIKQYFGDDQMTMIGGVRVVIAHHRKVHEAEARRANAGAG
ncbi:MAG TPA: hypothetical protein VN043_02670 [Rhodanobacter sp.]|nr:hypothetical protein [Rhodanobacter sp.]